jgi:hypothetical protein
VTGPSAVPPVSQSDAPSRPSRALLIVAIAVAIVWAACLMVMAWLTANPITLNRDQILRADFVITGTIDSDPHGGEVTVVREWKKNHLTGKIHLENLDEAPGARRGATYVMPLSHAITGYRVTDARLANSAALIYPATPEAIEQLEKMLAERARKE